MNASDIDHFIVYEGIYQNIPYKIVFENDFDYTAIAEGQVVCSSFSKMRTASKFKAIIDTRGDSYDRLSGKQKSCSHHSGRNDRG